MEKSHEKELVFEADEEDFSYDRLDLGIVTKRSRKGFDVDQIEVIDPGTFPVTQTLIKKFNPWLDRGLPRFYQIAMMTLRLDKLERNQAIIKRNRMRISTRA